MIVANTGRIIHCFALQNCIWNLIHNICHTIYIYPSLWICHCTISDYRI